MKRLTKKNNAKIRDFIIKTVPLYCEKDYFEVRDLKKLKENKDVKNHYKNFKQNKSNK